MDGCGERGDGDCSPELRCAGRLSMCLC
jgi:hypothetical protein